MDLTTKQTEAIRNSEFVRKLREEDLVETDNSEFIQWDGCLVSGINYGVLKRVTANGRSPLVFGDCIHVGLQNFFLGKSDWLELALARAQETKLDELYDARRNSRQLESLLRSYALEYRMKNDLRFEVVTINGEPVVEQGFTVPLGEVRIETVNFGTKTIRIFWLGKMDLLTKYSDKLASVDHKTTTVMGEKFADTYMRSSQMLGYTYFAKAVAKRLFGDDAQVFGSRINALAMRSRGFEFKVFDLPFADWKIAEWQRETLEAVRDRIHGLDRALVTGVVPPTREHCITKYGRCQYFDACDSAPTMRDRLIFNDEYFYVSDWSPLKKD